MSTFIYHENFMMEPFEDDNLNYEVESSPQLNEYNPVVFDDALETTERRKILRVVDSDEDILPRADETGFFVINDIKYGTLKRWRIHFGIPAHTAQKVMDESGLVPIPGKERMGRVRDFYSESDFKELFYDLIEKFSSLPHAEADGFIRIHGDTYATSGLWAHKTGFEETQITLRMKKNGIEGIEGVNIYGQASKFYSQKDVADSCQDLYTDYPVSDKNGEVLIDGVKYFTRTQWARELETGGDTILRRIESAELKPILCRDRQGHIKEYFSEPDIMSACSDLLEDLPTPNEDNFIIIDGEMYFTAWHWRKKTGISLSGIKPRLKKCNIQPRRCKNKRGKTYDYYKESDLKKASEDLSVVVPFADENGFIFIDGKRYGSLHVWADELGPSYSAISKRVKGAIITKIQGRDGKKQIFDFYPEDEIRILVADLIEELPHANEDGMIDLNGRLYGTFNAWCKFTGIYYSLITKTFKESGVKPIKGRDNKGRANIYYPQSVIRKKWPNLWKKLFSLDKLNENGKVEDKQGTFGTPEYWSNRLGVDPKTLSGFLKKSEAKQKKARGDDHRLREIYQEIDVRCLMEDYTSSQRELLSRLLANGELECLTVRRDSEVHKGLAGDTVHAISKKYTGIYAVAGKEFGLEVKDRQILVLVRRRTFAVLEREELF